MRIGDVTAVMLAAVSLLAAGCGHQQLTWPPAPADVDRINADAAEENGWLRVEYVEPIPRNRRVEPNAIEAIDATYITFRTRDGTTSVVRLDAIKGVTVKDRVRGAGLGAAVAGAGMSALMLALYNELRVFDEDPMGCWPGCDAKFFAYMVGSTALLGALFGYILGVRRTYYFNRVP